jgi:predicted RNA binding protein YcfA (HicA-like mRNA interferase family)
MGAGIFQERMLLPRSGLLEPVTSADWKRLGGLTGRVFGQPLSSMLGQPKANDMVTKHKILQKILAGSKNIRFSDMIEVVEGFGFRLSRTDGSHHIFAHPDIPELVNLQEVKGQAKPYQMRQFLKLIERHSLRLEEDK